MSADPLPEPEMTCGNCGCVLAQGRMHFCPEADETPQWLDVDALGGGVMSRRQAPGDLDPAPDLHPNLPVGPLGEGPKPVDLEALLREAHEKVGAFAAVLDPHYSAISWPKSTRSPAGQARGKSFAEALHAVIDQEET